MATTDKGFGRIYAPDHRDKNYPMRLALDPLLEQFFPKDVPAGTRHYRESGVYWDQGGTGTCVEHGWRHTIEAAPIMQPIPLPHFDLYRRIVLVDEWPENDYEARAGDSDLQSGTSVRAGAIVLQQMGLLKNYLWAESAADIRSWILSNFGGVVIGVNWSADMMDTDADGFVNYRGNILGGHCVRLGGWNDNVMKGGHRVRAARGKNSWGQSWGDGGHFWITEDDLQKLMADQGEACAPTEFRVKKAA